MDMTNQTSTVTADQNDRIRTNADRNVDQWTTALADAKRDGRTDMIPAIEQSLAFWTRTASRNHTGRVIR